MIPSSSLDKKDSDTLWRRDHHPPRSSTTSPVLPFLPFQAVEELDDKRPDTTSPPPVSSIPILRRGPRRRIQFLTIYPTLILFMIFTAFPIGLLAYLLSRRITPPSGQDHALFSGALVVNEGSHTAVMAGSENTAGQDIQSTLKGLTFASLIVS